MRVFLAKIRTHGPYFGHMAPFSLHLATGASRTCTMQARESNRSGLRASFRKSPTPRRGPHTHMGARDVQYDDSWGTDPGTRSHREHHARLLACALRESRRCARRITPPRRRAAAHAHARSRASTERETRGRDASPRDARHGRGEWFSLVLCESFAARRRVRVVDDRVVRGSFASR